MESWGPGEGRAGAMGVAWDKGQWLAAAGEKASVTVGLQPRASP